ncbi:gliding motility-associated C-terminal domain-containing protein [Mucilaginibacter litoreus]|uniref:Gliding motility-associated C-terminal domain-containing protein n=1 Tax=Mucilaginibacter litoreus TaxID=1048221 RepID=A0ABW3ARI4_9SPHI
MKTSTFFSRTVIVLLLLLFCSTLKIYAQRNFATTQRNGRSSVLCLGCVVNNPNNAIDGNLQTYSTLNVAVGVDASTYQELIFPGAKVAANTPATIKLGTGDNLLDVALLGRITIRAYNGSTPVGSALSATTLVSTLSNNNQVQLSITPAQTYDRVRVTLDGGLVGALGSIYLYDAFYNGNANVACNDAYDELHGVSAGLLNLGLDVGGVENPQNAIDGNINTASTLNAGIAAVGSYAQQTIIYERLSTIGDSVRLTLSIPQALIDAGVLANISISTYNGNLSNNDAVSFNSALVNLRLLDLTANRRKVTVTYAPAKIFDRVQLRLGGGIASVLSSLNLYEAEKLIPRPLVRYNNIVTDNANICLGSAVTLTVTATPNTTYNWYTQQEGGSPVHTGASYSPGVLPATTTYYVAAMRAGCTDESERTGIRVTVNPIPAAPIVAKNNITVCPGGIVTFTATPVTGVTINWYATETGGTVLGTGNSFTTPVINATSNFYAEAVTGNTCASPARTMVTATLSTLPAIPALTLNNPTICDGDVAVLSVASPVAGQTYNWYSTTTGGAILYTGINFTTPVLHSNANYYVEAVNATGCPSTARAQAIVTVSAIPASPVLAANNSTITAGQTATINVTNAQTGITYRWYTSANASTAVHTGNSYTTPQLYTNATYFVEAVNAAGCLSANRTAISINVNINNNSPCTFANTQNTNVNGICIGCSIENNALATDADTTTASTIHVIAGLIGGYAEQNLVFQQPGFTGDTVKLVLHTPVGLADANVAGRISVALYNSTTQVARYGLDNGIVKLRLLGGSNRYAVYVPATAAYDRVQVRLESGAASLVTALDVCYAIQQYSRPVFANNSPEICSGSPATLTITSPSNGSFRWFSTPTGGTSSITGATYTTGNLTSNTTYYVEYNRGTCVSPVRYPITVTVNNPPARPTVVPPNSTITAGQTATFKATAADGAIVKWYETATGGTTVFTGTTFTTPALSANKTYYAEAVLGDCPSPERTAVQVTVNPVIVPDVTVAPPTQAVNPGASATLVASSTTPNVTFNWYTQPTGGQVVYTGANFNTPPVFNPVTYYAEAVSSTGVRSATRAQGSITVNAVSDDPVPCDAAIAQTNTVGGGLLCALCSISNANGAIDNNRNTFSQLSVPVGIAGGYAQQTLRFANTGRAGDSILVDFGIPGSLANVGVLSQISLATYNGSTYNNDRGAINTSFITIRLLDGTSRFRVAIRADKDFDRVEIRLNSGLAGVLTALNVYDAAQEVAAPVISAANVTTCAGTQATLAATVPDHVTVKWYTTSSGGTPVATGVTFNTPVLTSTKTYYAEASRTADGCTQTVRTPVTVNVTPTPAAPVVNTPTVTVCSGQPATFTANNVAGVTFAWYTTPTGGTPVFTGNPFTTAALNASATYYVEAQGAGACESSTRTQVTANVTQTPLVPTVQQSTVQTCSGSVATLTANSTQTGVTFRWYTNATGGTPVHTGATFTTPELTADRSYYVEAASGDCVSATRARVDVDVTPTPANPTVTINPAGGQVTSGQKATLTATSTTAGAIFKWYTSATGGTAIYTGATFTTPALTSTTTYYVEAVLTATGCTSVARTSVTVTVNPIFSTSCDFASTQLNDVNGGLLCVGCAVANENAAIDADTTTASSLNLPVAVLGSYVSQTLIFSDSGLAGDSVTIKIGAPSTLLAAGVLGRIQVASYNGNTYNGDRVDISSSTISLRLLGGNTIAVIRFAPGAAYDRVEVRLNSAVSVFNSLNVYYASKQVDAPTVTASTINICSGSKATFTVSNPRPGVTYTWYTSATGSDVAGTGNTFTTDALNATTTYYVGSSRTSNSCANPNRVAVTANVTATPDNPTITQTANSICAGESVILNVTNASGVTVRWYSAATNGTLLFTGPSFTVSPVITTDYFAEISNGTCTSPARTQATVTVNPIPAKPGVDATDIQICYNSPATLEVTNPEAGVTYRWYTATTGGTVVYTGASITTDALTQNTSFYVEASNASGCINSGGRTRVNVSVTSQVSAPTLNAANTEVCSGGTVTISVNNPVAGQQYNFYMAATGGTPVFTGTSYTLNNVTASTSLFVEAVNGTCTSLTRTRANITVLPVPNPPQIQAPAGGLVACEGADFTISIADPQADLVYRWYSASTGGTLLYTGTEFTTNISATTTFYVEAASAGNCNSSARTPVTVTVSPQPADPTVASPTVTVCAGSSATLSVASPQAGVTYRWYDSPAQTTVLFTGPTFVTDPISATTNFYVAAFNINGCSSSNMAMVQVTVSAEPSAPVIENGNTVQSCAGEQVTLNIANPVSGFTYRWYTTATGGTAVFTGTSFTTSELSQNTTYYAEAVNATGCASSARTKVDINVNALPQAPEVTAQGGSTTPSVCAGSAATLTATSTTANVTFRWYDAQTGGNLLFTGATYTTPALTSATTYYVEAVSNTGNCISTTRTAIQVTINNSTAPQPQVDAAGLTICQNTSATITISNPDAATTYSFYTSAAGGSPVYTGTQFTTPVLTVNTTYYVTASNAQSCNPSARLAVNVVVTPQPATPIVTDATVTVCAGSPATLSVSSPQQGITYNWYADAGRTNKLFTGAVFVTDAINANTTFYVEAANGSCTSASVATVQVTVATAPSAPMLTDNTLNTCRGTQATLSIANPQAGVTYRWFNSSTGGTALFTGISFTTPVLNANATYYAEAVNATGCPSATRTSVTVNVSAAPAAPQVSTQGTRICPNNSTVLTATNNGSVTVNWYATATGGTALASGATFTTPVLTTTTTYYAEAVNNTGCPSATRTPVTVTILGPLPAPVVTVLNTTTSSVTFTYAAVPDAAGYEVSLDNGSTFTTPSSGPTGLTHIVSGLNPNQSVTIVVRALGATSCQQSANSVAVTGTAANPFGDGIFVPNAFTPNGDGNNDVLYVYGNTIQKVNFSVYDQWGQQQFRSTNLSSGWDGTYKGHAQPVGVYVYYLEATLNNGQIVKKKGTVTLIR